MNKYLNSIRKVEHANKKIVIRDVLICLFLGIILGVLSKYIDNLELNDAVWWQHIIGVLDLRNVLSGFGIWILISIMISVYSKSPWFAGLNVFTFLLSMCISYHIYTIIFSGFNPLSYMMIWYIITILSPLFAFICWYSKGIGIVSLVIKSIILCIMVFCSFAVGFWYFDFKSIIDTLIFICALVVIHNDYKSDVISLFLGITLSYLLRVFI